MERKHTEHLGEAVQVGPYRLRASGLRYLRAYEMAEMAATLIPMQWVPGIEQAFGESTAFPYDRDKSVNILSAVLPDFSRMPDNWSEFLHDQVIPLLEESQKNGEAVLAFCTASHGRTGTLIASLIAILEPEVDDPIAAARERHCEHAVETLQQAADVFALRGEPLPAHWREYFQAR